ncbi:ladderlectin-like [Centroberyx gerrardi]
MMLIVSILLCATFALKGNAAAKKPDPSCALGWSPYGSRCFIFNNNPVNWVQAEQHCLTLGANLASVHSLEEYEFIQAMVKGSSGSLPETWIGGSDNAQDRTWFWSDGSSFDYLLWNSGEPNNSGGREPCIEMNHGGRSCQFHPIWEYQFIQEMVKGSSSGFPDTWIGGSDNAQNRTWFWSDGSNFDYQYWASGEPNNYGGRQPCIEMDFGERLMSEQVEVQCHMAVAGLHVISVAAP